MDCWLFKQSAKGYSHTQQRETHLPVIISSNLVYNSSPSKIWGSKQTRKNLRILSILTTLDCKVIKRKFYNLVNDDSYSLRICLSGVQGISERERHDTEWKKQVLLHVVEHLYN